MYEFPYTNFHELNLDYILKEIKTIQLPVTELRKEVADLSVDVKAEIDNFSAEINDIKSQVDSAEQTLTYALTNIRRSYHRGVVTNPDFSVAQLGYPGQVGSRWYVADRWVSESGQPSVVKTDTGITFSAPGDSGAAVYQLIDKQEAYTMLGQTMTLVIYLTDGTILAQSGIVEKNTPCMTINYQDKFSCYLQFFDDADSYQLCRFTIKPGAAVALKAVQIYPGAYSENDAPFFTPSPYSNYYACRKVLNVISKSEITLVGTAINTRTLKFTIPVTEPMRITPSVVAGYFTAIYGSGSSLSNIGIEGISAEMRQGAIEIAATIGVDLTAYSTYSCQFTGGLILDANI